MNKKYKYCFSLHIVGLSIVLFMIVLVKATSYYTKKPPFDVIDIVCILSALFACINNLFAYYMIEEKGIRLKSLIREINLEWKEINYIVQQPAGKFVGISVGIFSMNKRITITCWTKNYKEFLKLVINECQKRGNVSIDSKVIEILK